MEIQMVDLKSQYKKIETDIQTRLKKCMENAAFINGSEVSEFQNNLQTYLHVKHVIPCANGTDALQIAMMALDLQPGDEVIVPAFTYVATAEVIGLLKLKPVMVDVDPYTFNINAEIVERAITPKTKAIVPVHLFGQSCDMEGIMKVARAHNLFVIEDNAQALGSVYTYSDGTTKFAGCIGDIGTTSFFPSKNLGAYGDGGAIMTNNDELAIKIRMVANHGQSKKYYHDVIGVNSRLDSMQAAILNVKLPLLNSYSAAREKAASNYDDLFAQNKVLEIPFRATNATHVFHQYTLKLKTGKRDALQEFLKEHKIPSMIYYPVPLYKQKAFQNYFSGSPLPVTEKLCEEVLSLPMHTELSFETQEYIANTVNSF